jgi:RNA polymerase sigma-54 factor
MAMEFVIGNLDGDGYLAGSEEELAGAFSGLQDEPETGAVLELLRQAINQVQKLDPAGVGARSLRECLLIQIAAQQREFAQLFARQSVDLDEDVHRGFRAEAEAKLEERRRSMEVAALIADKHLHLLQKRDVKDLAHVAQITPAEAHCGVEYIRTLDPRPGRQYNREQSRLIEPDVVFIKRGDTWVVSMNEEDLPSLRLSRRYRQMLTAKETDKEVKDYVKERFRSALQLMRNIAQRKSTILRTCEVIVRRQQDFLDVGIEGLRPMMIKEVAEEIGVHPSTISRAVANKYAHTPQGVIELRFFFSEGSNGPEGADTPLLVLKRKVRKLIEEEDARHPLTDDQLTAVLQSQGIQLTRRTVAKYREDMNIPSTHQRRRREG